MTQAERINTEYYAREAAAQFAEFQRDYPDTIHSTALAYQETARNTTDAHTALHFSTMAQTLFALNGATLWNAQ